MIKVPRRQSLYQEYQGKKELWDKVILAVKSDVESILKAEGIILCKVDIRIKEFDSFWFKLNSNEDQRGEEIKEPLLYIQDIIGVRAVLLFVDDLNKIENLLKPTFKILEVERKSDGMPDDQFGYESDHYILQYDDVKGPRYEEIRGCKFELQVRTVLMDAWDSLSHHLDYKSKEAIPSHLRRVFYGLSGMFVVADSTFQKLNNLSERSQQNQIEKIQKPEELLKQEINLDSFKAYLQYKFPERWKLRSAYNTDEEFSKLIKEIKSLGKYNIVSDLDKAVDEVMELELESELIDLPDGSKRALIGTIRGVLDLYDDNYFKRYEKFVGTEPFEKIKRLRDKRKKSQK